MLQRGRRLEPQALKFIGAASFAKGLGVIVFRGFSRFRACRVYGKARVQIVRSLQLNVPL